MSKSINYQLSQVVTTTENLVESFNKFDYDNDVSGKNGDKYTSKIALSRGYKTTLEMILDDAKRSTFKLNGLDKVEVFAKIVLSLLKQEDFEFYNNSEMTVVEVENDMFVVAFMCIQTS